MNKEIRWKQRFNNLQNAFLRLESAVQRKGDISRLEEEGLVQRFEYTFELSWKTLKDYLEYSGILANAPREIFKEAFNKEILRDGQTWIDMLEERNLLAHTYSEENFEKAIHLIRKRFYPEIENLYQFFKGKLNA